MGGTRILVLIGILAWGVSWFVSPHQAVSMSTQADDLVGGLGKELGGSGSDHASLGYGGPPGWRAFRFSWDLLSGKQEGTKGSEEWKNKCLGASGLTNVLMVVALLVLLAQAAGRGARPLGFLLLLAAALDASWLYLTDAEFRSGLEAGYWLWLGSFVLAGLGFLPRGRPAAP